MEQLWNWIEGGAAIILLSAAVRALPEPARYGNKFYRWFFKFTHLVLANFDKIKK